MFEWIIVGNIMLFHSGLGMSYFVFSFAQTGWSNGLLSECRKPLQEEMLTREYLDQHELKTVDLRMPLVSVTHTYFKIKLPNFIRWSI